MAGNDAAERFLEALNEGSGALIDRVRAANDRRHRLSTALIEEVQEGQREAVELAKKWAAAPLDLLGWYGSLIESTTKAQGRALDVTRLWFGELSDARKETRELLQRMVSANRHAGEATLDFARDMFGRASETVQSTVAGTDGDGRRTARATAKSSGASTAESEASDEA